MGEIAIKYDLDGGLGSMVFGAADRRQPRFKIPRAENASWTRITPLEDAANWLAESLRRLSELAALPENWNSYGAESPNASTLEGAKRLLAYLASIDFKPSDVDPSADGGVCVSFSRGTRYADVEFLNSGSSLAVISRRDGNPTVWDVVPDEHGFATAVQKIRAHF